MKVNLEHVMYGASCIYQPVMCDKSRKVHCSTGCVMHDCAPLPMHTVYHVFVSAKTTPSRLIIHAMQVLATNMPCAQYHKYILLRATMGIFIHTSFVLPSEFKCDPNVPILAQLDLN